MQKKYFLLAFTGAVLLCGCDKQAKINSEKIQILSQSIVQLEQNQARQMTALQTQLASLAPMLDKINDFYFEKSHDDAFFYHTNTLYLLLTVDKKIESQLQVAETERAADSSLAYYYHTNQTDTIYFCAGQIRDVLTGLETRLRDAMDSQEKRIDDNVNAQTSHANAALRDELLKQIKLSSPDPAAVAQLKVMAADVAQIKRDLAAINTKLGPMTNSPAARP